jgi:hypothetical protein
LVGLPACWCVAPFVGYWSFLLLVAGAALFPVPTFAITRQVIIGHTTLEQRTTALSIDGITTDLTFMVGPVIGVLLATTIPTPRPSPGTRPGPGASSPRPPAVA